MQVARPSREGPSTLSDGVPVGRGDTCLSPVLLTRLLTLPVEGQGGFGGWAGPRATEWRQRTLALSAEAASSPDTCVTNSGSVSGVGGDKARESVPLRVHGCL